jgi:tRNA dimethylallyltransferase
MTQVRSSPESARSVSAGSPTILLSGPTGIGKTDLAVELAQRLPLEIISTDSMQVYRGMEIGTAQPTADQQVRATFHVCGRIDPREHFSVKRFLGLCDEAHAAVVSRGRLPVYVGGTGLYLRALRWGLFEQPASDGRVRARLEAQIERQGAPALHARLAQVDPVAAERTQPADVVRIVRALEVYEITRRPLSQLQEQWERPQPRFPHVLVVLTARREQIRRRIAVRTARMLAGGWIEEVQRLLEDGVPEDQHCFKALGYTQIVDYLRGRCAREQMEERIVTLTGQFARRQLIWLRRERPAIWLAVDESAGLARVADLEKLLAKPSKPYV